MILLDSQLCFDMKKKFIEVGSANRVYEGETLFILYGKTKMFIMRKK